MSGLLSWLGSFLFEDADETERKKVKEELERMRASDQRYGEVDLNRPPHLFENAFADTSHNILLTIVDTDEWENAIGEYSANEHKSLPLFNAKTATAFIKAQYFTREKIDKILADYSRLPPTQRPAIPVAREPSIMFVYFYRYNQEIEEQQTGNSAWEKEIVFKRGAGTVLKRAIDKRRDLHAAFPVKINLANGQIEFPSSLTDIAPAFLKCSTQHGIKSKQLNWRFESSSGEF